MKRIEEKKKKKLTVVETPWLHIDEAAAYLGIARSTFDDVRRAIPNGSAGGRDIYHCQILDRFANGDLPDEVYEKTPPDAARPRRRRSSASVKGLTDPGTGKVYEPGRPGARQGGAAL